MYFPYLVARGEEVNALNGLNILGPDSNIVPILQAFSDDDDVKYSYPALMKACRILIERRNKFILLLDSNDEMGELGEINDFNSYCIRGYNYDQFHSISFQEQVDYALFHFAPSSGIHDHVQIKYHVFMPTVIRFDTYINSHPLNKVVLMEDAFIKHEPNRDYPRVDIFNTELPFTYATRGYLGFGDFTLMSYNSSISGQANANDITHVIHLSRLDTDSSIFYVDHYLTTPTEEPDNSTRSRKTLRKVGPNLSHYETTSGIIKLSALISSGDPTSLGMYKRIGIMHHIELMYLTLN